MLLSFQRFFSTLLFEVVGTGRNIGVFIVFFRKTCFVGFSEIDAFFCWERLLAYVLDISFCFALVFAAFCIGAVAAEDIVFFSALFGFFSWSVSEAYLGSTLGRLASLSLSKVLAVFLPLLGAVFSLFFLQENSFLIVFVFFALFFVSYSVYERLPGQTVFFKKTLCLRYGKPFEVLARNLWKAAGVLFFPFLFVDALLVFFTKKRLIDFALSTEVVRH